jgi:EmrB/QacA subfamily drug resistance transporter
MTDSTLVSTRRGNPWLSLVGICIVTALVWVTASDISIALPTIGAELGGNMDTLQWAVNGYFLAGAFIIVGGRLGDLFGRRIVFAIGTIAVVVGSVVAGLAPSTGVLIIGRVIEGLGAAAILPTALAIVVVSFKGRQRETAIGIWIAVCWGSQALGPLVGGALIAALNWRWLFWINLPIAILALILMWATTPESRESNAPRSVDVPGAIAIVLSVFLVSYALVSSDTLGLIGAAGLLLAAVVVAVIFVFIERRAKVPVVVLSIFTKGRFNGAVVSNLIANVIFGAVVFFMSLYLQVVEGYDPLMAGALLLPATIPILLVNPIGTAISRRFGPAWPTAIGMALLAVAAYLLTTLGGSYVELLIPFILIGIGIGLQITPCAAAAVEDPGEAGEGTASGIFKAASMIGGSLGVAISTAVFQNVARGDAGRIVPGFTPDATAIDTILSVLTGGAAIDVLASIVPGDAQAFVTRLFDDAIGAAMWPSIVSAIIGVIIALWLLRGKPKVAVE